MTGQSFSYAGLGSRLTAALLDALVLALPIGFVGWFLRGMYLDHGEVLVTVIGLLAALAYSAVMTASPLQGTLGKRTLRIVVADDEGLPLTLGASFVRTLSVPLSVLTFGAGLLLVLFTARRQALHDLVCRTVVLHEPHPINMRPYPTVARWQPWEPGVWRGPDL